MDYFFHAPKDKNGEEKGLFMGFWAWYH